MATGQVDNRLETYLFVLSIRLSPKDTRVSPAGQAISETSAALERSAC